MHAIDITIAANAGMLFVFDCESGMWDSGEANAHKVRSVKVLYIIVLVPCARVILFWGLGLFSGLFFGTPH